MDANFTHPGKPQAFGPPPTVRESVHIAAVSADFDCTAGADAEHTVEDGDAVDVSSLQPDQQCEDVDSRKACTGPYDTAVKVRKGIANSSLVVYAIKSLNGRKVSSICWRYLYGVCIAEGRKPVPGIGHAPYTPPHRRDDLIFLST